MASILISSSFKTSYTSGHAPHVTHGEDKWRPCHELDANNRLTWGAAHGEVCLPGARRRRFSARVQPRAVVITWRGAQRVWSGKGLRYTGPMTSVTPARPGRNEPCYCGSGRKYKQCCLAKDEADAAEKRAAANAAQAAEAPASEASASDSKTKGNPVHKPPHQTHQPWKGNTLRGFAPKTRLPRKAGGS